MVLIQLLFTYATFMNNLFSSAPMPINLWGDVLAVSLVAYLVIEFEKWLRRRTQK